MYGTRGRQVIQERLGPLFAILDYAQARKVDVMLGEWDPPRSLGIRGTARSTMGSHDY